MPRRPGPAFLKEMQPDEVLTPIVGAGRMPRTEATKRLWVYIKSHDLQDPAARRFILADDNLRRLFDGADRVSMFALPKFLNRHLVEPSAGEPVPGTEP